MENQLTVINSNNVPANFKIQDQISTARQLPALMTSVLYGGIAGHIQETTEALDMALKMDSLNRQTAHLEEIQQAITMTAHKMQQASDLAKFGHEYALNVQKKRIAEVYKAIAPEMPAEEIEKTSSQLVDKIIQRVKENSKTNKLEQLLEEGKLYTTGSGNKGFQKLNLE